MTTTVTGRPREVGARVATARAPMGFLCLLGFIACVWGSNYLITRYGVVSVGFGLSAPAGVYTAGLSFGLRDAVQETLGRRWVLAGIGLGAAAAYLLSDSVTIPGGHLTVALASGVAFAISELADFAIYSPLRERHWLAAVVLSNLVGSVADSALFLWLSFGSLNFLQGQVVGKTYMTVAALPIVWLARRRRK